MNGLTAEDVARRFGVKPWTIRHWTVEGRIPHHRLGVKLIRYNWRPVLRAIILFVPTSGIMRYHWKRHVNRALKLYL